MADSMETMTMKIAQLGQMVDSYRVNIFDAEAILNLV